MKKFYKVALALAIALGSVSAFAVGSAQVSTGNGIEDNEVEVYSVGNVVFVKNAEGEKVTIVSITGKTETAVVNGGQVEVKTEGVAVVKVGNKTVTVYLTK